MAVLGKIRSKGVILITIIGFGLFAFIAEEAFRSCESAQNESSQQVGEILGDKVNVQEFQKVVDEYVEVIKMQQGTDNLDEAQLNRVRDMVWNTMVQSKIIEKETKALGLTVTDEEMQNILRQGTNPMLMQTPFINQQTGRFDVNALQKFLAEYKTQKTANPQLAQQYETIYKYWTFTEKQLRQQLLVQKYQGLLAQCFLSNKVEAERSFKETNEESNIQLAAFPFASIDDSKVTVSDADLKAKYEEVKELFRQYVETRDVKYVDIEVQASASDKAALQKEFAGYAKDLAEAADPTEVVRKSTSQVAYLGVPVSKDAFPMDIASRLDSMAVGATSSVIETKTDNTLNLIKLVSKQQLPDSVQYCQIQVGGKDADEAATRADSIYAALQAGADFEALAKKYGQTGEKTWLTTRQYQSAPSIDKDTRGYLYSLNTMSVGETKNIKLTQGNIIVRVADRKGFITKYEAAVIKKNIDFSRATYSAAYNKFSAFVSANQSLDAITKNAAKSGYTVLERPNISTSEHTVANISATREALKWVFSAKEGEVSPLYECGNNNHLLVVVLNKIHKKGYRELSDPQVNSYVKNEVLKDKKAEQLIAKAEGVKSVGAAKGKGAVVTTVNQITFAAPAFISATGASEPALSGAIAATAKGKFSAKPVRGNGGVYLFQVTGRSNRPGKFDATSEMQKLRQKQMQQAGNFMNELYIKADVKDNRYLFF